MFAMSQTSPKPSDLKTLKSSYFDHESAVRLPFAGGICVCSPYSRPRHHCNQVGPSVFQGTEDVLMEEICQELCLVGLVGLVTRTW